MKSFIKNQTLLIHYHLECTTAATKATKYCHQNVLRRDTDNYSYFLPNPKQPNHWSKPNKSNQNESCYFYYNDNVHIFRGLISGMA